MFLDALQEPTQALLSLSGQSCVLSLELDFGYKGRAHQEQAELTRQTAGQLCRDPCPYFLLPASSHLQLRGFLSQVKSLDPVILSGFIPNRTPAKAGLYLTASICVCVCVYVKLYTSITPGNCGIRKCRCILIFM